MRYSLSVVTVLVSSSLLNHLSHAAAAVGWRSDGTGLYPKANPVLEWSPTENVVWKTPLPEWGNSMPVLVSGKLFVNVEPDTLVCVSAAKGEILWKQPVKMEDTLTAEQRKKMEENRGEIEKLNAEMEDLNRQGLEMGRTIRRAADSERAALEQQRSELTERSDAIAKKLAGMGGVTEPPTHQANGYTSPTPVSDGKGAFVVYGTGVVAALDLEGKRLWTKLHEQPAHQWGHSTSPLLVDGKLIVHLKTMMALKPDSGDIVWKTEIPESWGTPAVGDVGGVKILVTARGDIVRASDGKKLADNLFELPFGSPIIHQGVIYGVDENGGFAFALPKKIEGETIEVKNLWRNAPPRDRYYSSAVVVDGVLYAMNRGQRLSAIDAATGEILYSERVDLGRGQQLYGSFCLAGNHLFVGHDNGQIAVLKPGRTFEIVKINSLEPSRSTPIFDGNRMYFRTDKNLYCIGRP